MASTPKRVGVDIGSSAIRVVEVSGIDRDGYAVVSRVAEEPLAEGALREGRPADLQQVAVALNRALKSAKVAPQGFVLGLSVPETAVGRRMLPAAVKQTEWVSTIRNSGWEVSPLAKMADSIVDVRHVREDVDGEGRELDVLSVGVARRSDIDTMMSLCKLAKLAPRALDLTGVAMLRALVRDTDESRDVAAYVDIGSTTTTVVTREGRSAHTMRCLNMGGTLFTRAVQEVRGLPFEEAERLKARLKLSPPGASVNQGPVDLSSYGLADDDRYLEDREQTKLENAFERAGEQLINTIVAAVESGQSSDQGSVPPPEEVYLVGGSALVGGLRERLQHALQIPVRIARPWATIAPHERNAAFRKGEQDDPLALLRLSPAIGLALWKDER